jgi:hypothetical protein
MTFRSTVGEPLQPLDLGNGFGIYQDTLHDTLTLWTPDEVRNQSNGALLSGI